MNKFLDAINQVTDFIVGKEESTVDKNKKTMGFVSQVINPKRKYRKRKKK